MRQKYGNRKVEFMGQTFDSARERDRYAFLLGEVQSGTIRDLRRQVSYVLVPELRQAEEVRLKTKTKTVERVVQRAVTYRADFVYVRCADGVEVTEDVKISPYLIPKEYVIKEKLLRWRYGIVVRRVYKATESV